METEYTMKVLFASSTVIKHCFVFNYTLVLPLHRMKKWLVLLLFFITAAGTFIPCCSVDSCCTDQLATSANHEKRQTEGTCSPFFACATCPGSVELAKPIQLIQPVIEKQVHHEQLVQYNLTTYPSSFWQPPRFC